MPKQHIKIITKAHKIKQHNKIKGYTWGVMLSVLHNIWMCIFLPDEDIFHIFGQNLSITKVTVRNQ